jgi:hypothetical protein
VLLFASYLGVVSSFFAAAVLMVLAPHQNQHPHPHLMMMRKGRRPQWQTSAPSWKLLIFSVAEEAL